MSNTDQAPDPSMEEILASIRRIISDDDAPAEEKPEIAAVPTPEVEPEPEPEPEVDEANADIDAMMADMVEEDMEVSDDISEMPDFDVVSDPDPEPEDEDIFDLTEVVEEKSEEPSAQKVPSKDFVGVDEQDLCFDEVDHEPGEVVPAPPALKQSEPVSRRPPHENLLSPSAAAEASAAFGVLANTILTSSGNARTLEDLVQELLRPMLQSWLDDNLPPLVERLVREEIERVARQGR